MSSPAKTTFSSLPTEVQLRIFQLAASPDSEPEYEYFFTDGEFYFSTILNLDHLPGPHPIHEGPCPKRSLLEALFCDDIWGLTEQEDMDTFNESTVYATRHALLHTCRLGREVALLTWMEYIKGLRGGIYEFVRRAILDALATLLAQIQKGSEVVVDRSWPTSQKKEVVRA